MANKKYTSKDIKVLSDFEHVRKRTQVYLGSTTPTEYSVPLFDPTNDSIDVRPITFVPALYKAFGEIIDNSVDELTQTGSRKKIININTNPILGMYTVKDNGRGVPITRHESGKYTPEVVFGSLRSGRNFDDDRHVGVIGMNGVGSACTNAISSSFEIKIHRDKKVYHQKFTDGGTKVSRPHVQKDPNTHTGTEITFSLDTTLFKDISLPEPLVRNRAIELALTNPGINVLHNGNRYHFKTGFDQFIKRMSKNYYKFETENIEFFVIFDKNESEDEQIFTWVNSSFLFDGGICNTQFMNAFTDKTIAHLAKAAKKQKAEITKSDVKHRLMIIGNIKISDPQYDSQAKTRLTGPNMRSVYQQMIDDQWQMFQRKNKKWLEEVLEHAMMRYHSRENSRALKDHKKKLNKKVAGLIDATNKQRHTCRLLITEGLSASAQITQARDPQTTAAIALKGKVNNVQGATVAQLLKMSKMTDLISVIGLIPGHKVEREDLRYGKIVIATDADPDGSHITALLINLFYHFWPELFDSSKKPIVHRLIVPNIVVSKGKKRLHFKTREEFESVKAKYKGYTITYMKGLGSMVTEDWKMVLSGNDYLIPLVDDGEMGDTLELLFGDNADLRKEWLTE